MLAPSLISVIAQSLYDAERGAEPVERLTGQYNGLDTPSAYAVQERYAAMRRKAGARVVGRKIGCTSKVIQELFKIETPDFGHLFDDMQRRDNAAIDLTRLIEPMVEPEIAFRLAAELRGPGVTAADVLRATGTVMPALEIIDSRIRHWGIAFEDTVADNGSSALFVLGVEQEPDAGFDFAAESVSFRRDGVEVDADQAAAVLGNPLNSVAWLANAIAEFDRGLAAGEIVLSGSITKAARVEGAASYEAVFSTIGRVGCAFV